MRIQAEMALLVVAPRWFVELCGDENRSPVDEDVWADTLLHLPRSLAGREWNNVLTGERIMLSGLELSLVQLLRQLPVGVLFSEHAAATREAD